jgi:hypothetical protein
MKTGIFFYHQKGERLKDFPQALKGILEKENVFLYDAFYPLLRNDIPANTDGLLDVQGAKLLALVPEGAFLSDASGGTFLLWEGEPVYLGYLTSIDYKNNKVKFIINRGGVIEKVELYLEKEETNKKK